MSKTGINTTEIEERFYLEEIKNKLNYAVLEIEGMVRSQFNDMMEQKKYLSESKADMDHVEKVSVRQSIEQIALVGEHGAAKKQRLLKLIKSPYFGRIDFSTNGEDSRIPFYIGIHTFTDSKTDANLIYDWRAPISSMFYDFELGEAFYKAPEGKTEGKIFLKRQYRIEHGKLKYMLESSLNIHDDVLQKELSQASNEKMKNIVATIQREQNAIIRNDQSSTLIIQGAAGSGKTSIALHRIAFLLYKFKDTITSNDILIISPNKVFADYISNVLPELGEEKIRETSMYELAAELLQNQYKFQSFFEQVAQLLEKKDKGFGERIAFKASTEFIKRMDEYILHIKKENLKPVDIINKWYVVPAWFIDDRFKANQRMPVEKRITEVVNAIVENVKIHNNYEIKGKERNEIRKKLKQMFRTTNLRVLYKEFYEWLEKPGMFKLAKGSMYEYSDVYPLIYIKMQLEGLRRFEKVKHLVIDEMQDYTPVQYRMISRLFQCKKTILGDSNQSVNPFSSSSAELISRIFPNADCMYMNKSYRSTIEISEFTQHIHRNENLEAIERHGEKPVVKAVNTKENEIKVIINCINAFVESKSNALGIICKTQAQAKYIYEQVKDVNTDINLLDPESKSFSNGIIVTTAHMAKGLEFDEVIAPFCSEENYKTEIDKHMLYVACTRAMHRLTVTYSGKNSLFLNWLIN